MEKEEGRRKQKEKLPQSWLALPLEDIAEVNPRSFCPLPTANDMLVHFVPMAAVSEGFSGIDVSSQRLLSDVQRGYTAFLEADVLLAKITPCMENGKLAVVPKLSNHLGYGSTEFHVIRATSAVQPQWLAFYFSKEEFRRWARKDMTGSAGQLRVSTQWLSRIKLPLAPLAEQSRIVAKLEELVSDLNAGVSELKAAQKKLMQYRQSLLKAAVEGALTAEWRAERAKRGEPLETGAQLLERILAERRRRWEEKQLAKFKEQGKTPPKDWRDKYPEQVKPNTADLPELPEGWVWASAGDLIAEIETGKSFKCDERPPTSNEIGVVKVSSVSWGEYDEQESKTCTDLDRVNEALFVRPGDFLFSRANTIELVGACVIASTVTLRVMLSDKILRFIFVVDGLNKWLLFLLRSDLGRFQIEALASGNQESMRNIGQERIRQIAVPLPPPEEIEQILVTLDQCHKAAFTQAKAIEYGLKQSSAQRQNILKAAFSGQLVPQDPSDEPASVLLERIRAERAARESGGGRRGRKAREDGA